MALFSEDCVDGHHEPYENHKYGPHRISQRQVGYKVEDVQDSVYQPTTHISLHVLGSNLVLSCVRQVDHESQDRCEEYKARDGGSEPETAVALGDRKST